MFFEIFHFLIDSCVVNYRPPKLLNGHLATVFSSADTFQVAIEEPHQIE